ncbi:phage tail assembly protein, partial [Escherichia coli]
MKEIKLSKPVRAHGEDIHVLELREPTGKDVREL